MCCFLLFSLFSPDFSWLKILSVNLFKNSDKIQIGYDSIFIFVSFELLELIFNMQRPEEKCGDAKGFQSYSLRYNARI